jgi:hypothetical protein
VKLSGSETIASERQSEQVASSGECPLTTFTVTLAAVESSLLSKAGKAGPPEAEAASCCDIMIRASADSRSNSGCSD